MQVPSLLSAAAVSFGAQASNNGNSTPQISRSAAPTFRTPLPSTIILYKPIEDGCAYVEQWTSQNLQKVDEAVSHLEKDGLV